MTAETTTSTSATAATRPEPILSVRDLTKHYPLKSGVVRHTVGHVKAVDGVSFDLYPGETLGVVGESGCGKSTLGRLLVALEPPTSGTITFEGRDATHLRGSEMRKLRRDIQIVFQDPYTSLDPRMTVGDIVSEPFRIHPDAVPRGKRTERVKELLDVVGLNPEHINRYPHEFSGASVNASVLPAASRCSPRYWCVTSQCRLWTSRCRPRSSTCCRSCRGSWEWPISSSPTTYRWCVTSPTGWP